MSIKWLCIASGFFLLLAIPSSVFAHPGNTDSLGCHTCRTNCPSWGLYYGEYHCHEPKYYPPPEIYTPTPSCPLFSYYDSLTDTCKCYSGYVASGDKCISQDEYCQNLHGFNSRYNILNDTCECSYGYVFDGDRCISGNQYCWNKYDYNSSYNGLNKSCECSYGYVFNKLGTQCISKDAWCREQLGFGSEYGLLEDACVCSLGYKYDRGGCVIEVPVYEPPPTMPALPTFRPTPTPREERIPAQNVLSTQSQSASPTPSPAIMPQKSEGKYWQKNLIFSIWQFIKGLLGH
jgi:hypothetical protein